MTTDEYESAIGTKNLARWEAMAAANGKTGEQLAAGLSEFVKKHAARICEDLGISLYSDADAGPTSSVSSTDGNVTHVNFKLPRRAPIAARAGIQKRAEARRQVVSDILVPSTSPEADPAQNTVFPYSIR